MPHHHTDPRAQWWDHQEPEERRGFPIFPPSSSHMLLTRIMWITGSGWPIEENEYVWIVGMVVHWSGIYRCWLKPSLTLWLWSYLEFPVSKTIGQQAVLGPGSPPAFHSSPQTSLFSLPFYVWFRYPAASSVKDIPKIPSMPSNPRHGDEASLHDLPGKLTYCSRRRGGH